MSISTSLLTTVIESAKARGLDQKALALKAGISAETISRGKKRGTLDLATVNDLAHAAGLALCLSPMDVQQKPPPADASPLTDPKWGLAWSNPAMPAEALVRNALLKGAFSAILEAALYYGMAYVRGQWESICAGDAPLSPKSRRYISGMLRNIETGFSHAQT